MLIAFMGAFTIQGQDNSNKGTDFWLGFMDHIEGDDANMYLYITSDTNANVTVSIPGQNWSANYTVTKNSMTLVSVPTDKSRVSCSDCKQAKGIHVTASLPVVVYSHIYETYKSDATLVLPTLTTGKEYYCMGYTQVQQRRDPNESSQFMVVASQDSTKINITPSCDIEISTGGEHKAGTTYSITLNKGEVYQGKGEISGNYANADITGTFVQVIDTGKNANCRTVAVFSGSSNSMIGCTSSSASSDILFEQMFPKSSLGNKFIVVPSKDKTSDRVRVMAVENSTVVRIGTTNYNLNAGKFHEFTISGSQIIYIRSPKPVMVAQYHTSQLSCGGGYGDPSMIMLTPIEQTLEDIVLYSASRQRITKNFINVVIPTTGVSSFRLDGTAVSFTQVPSYTAYSYAQLSVSSGNHRLTSDVGFNAIAYGFGSYESYGYAAGANIKNRAVYIDLANTNYEKDLGVCHGEQVSFQGKVTNLTITKWEWDFGDGNSDTVQNPKHNYSKPGTYTVIMKAYKKNSNGCSSFDSSVLELAIYASPKAGFSYTAGCTGDVTFFSDSTKIDSGYSIQANIWSLGSGFVFGKNVSRAFADTGWYTITNQAVSVNNCRNTATKKIFINPKPDVNFGFENLCSGQNTQFTDSTKIDVGNIVGWNWQFNSGSDSSNIQNPSYTFPSFGSNSVELIAESDSGCFNSWDTTLTISDSIKANFTVRDTCINKTFTFINTSHEGSSSLSYQWEFGDDSTSTLTSPSHNYLNAKNHVVSLIASQDNKCFDTLKRNITVYPLASGKIFYKDACLGDATTVYNTYNLGIGTITDFDWKINGSSESTDSSFVKNFTNSGKYNLELEYTTNFGCISSVTDSVIINPPPVAVIWTNGIDELCFGEDLRLVDSSKTSDSIAISEFTYLANNSTKKEYNYTTDSTGIRTFYLKVTSKYGCKDSTTKDIVVNPGPVNDFLFNESCVNVNQTISNFTTLESGTIVKWEWSENGNVLSTSRDPILKFATSGTKTLKLNAESNNGCKDSIEYDLTIWDNPAASFEFDTVCVGSASNFNSTSVANSGVINNYNWDYGDANSGTGANTANIYATPGTYTVELITVTDKNCTDTVENNILVGSIPVADFSADNLIGCIPQDVNFTDLSSVTSGSIAEWEWDFGNALTSAIQNPSTGYLNPGIYTISLKVTSDLGCADDEIKNSYLEIFNLPTADFSMNPDTPTFLNPDVQFTDLSVGNGISAWDWEFGNGDVSTDQNPFYAFGDTGLYNIVLKVTDINGCTDTAVKSIFLTPILKFYMPNAFYPNDNGRNDIFKPGGVFQGINDYTIEIHNRWGELMYSGTDAGQGWDGTFGGKLCPMGVYIYKIRYTDYTRSKWFDLVGDFTLLR